jgi:DHA3 family macrolide efflux protein-like MFS transporter
VNSKISYELFVLLFGIIAFFIGGLVAIINIPIETYIQQNTETAMMGRVNSVLGTLSMATIPFALVLGGIAVEVISVEFAYFFSAIVLIITTGSLLFRKELS